MMARDVIREQRYKCIGLYFSMLYLYICIFVSMGCTLKESFLLLLIILINVTLGALIILVLSLINYLSIFYCEINKI